MPGTLVVETTWVTDTGWVVVKDALTIADWATSGEDTDGETTETPNPVTPEQEAACEAGCQNEAMCIGEPDASECVLGCIEEFQYIEEECASPYSNFVQCIAELSCLDLEGDIEDSACGDELAALETCDGPACVMMQEETTEDSCGFGRSCPEQPTQSISCEGDTCRCFLDETEVAQCAADGVCMEGDAIFDKMASCCQFE